MQEGDNVKTCKFEKIDTGFIDPEGRFYPCEYGEHINLACEILKNLYGIDDYIADPERVLALNGWLTFKRIGLGQYEWMIDWDSKWHLTPEQIRTIKPIVEDNKERILRSSICMLEYEFSR